MPANTINFYQGTFGAACECAPNNCYQPPINDPSVGKLSNGNVASSKQLPTFNAAPISRHNRQSLRRVSVFVCGLFAI